MNTLILIAEQVAWTLFCLCCVVIVALYAGADLNTFKHLADAYGQMIANIQFN